MGGIICEHLVEEQVAVLETSGMDRNDQHSFIIARIWSDQPVSRSDAGKNNLGAADKRLRIIDNGKRYIAVFLEPADEVSLLPLMSKKSHMDFPLRFHGLHTEQSGPARVSESHKAYSLAFLFLKCLIANAATAPVLIAVTQVPSIRASSSPVTESKSIMQLSSDGTL